MSDAGKDNTLWLLAQPARTAAGGRLPGGRCGRVGRVLAAIGAVLLSWLAAIPRRVGDRLFTMNDTEACWQSWQITNTHGGLGRRYRDLEFDTLAQCPKCRGSGGTADLSCPPCLGTGRVTLGR